MEEDKIERAIQFLLDNQASHDVRLARLEEMVEKLAISQDKMREDLYEGLRQMQEGLQQMHEGIDKLTEVCEQTTKQIQNVLELEIRTSSRVRRLEQVTDDLTKRVEILEDDSDSN